MLLVESIMNSPRFQPFRATIHGDTIWLEIPSSLVASRRSELIETLSLDDRPGVRHVIADFLGCLYIDSTGLGALYSVNKKLRARGGGLACQNLTEDLRVLFELTKLDEVFLVLEDPRQPAKCQLIIPQFEQINSELVEFLARHPDKLENELNWRDFELLIEAVFRNQGFRTELGSGRADGGVDLRLVHSDICGDLLTLVQIKRYDRSRPIRLEAVQALCAVVDDQKANRGLFVTTSRYLPSARQFAERQGSRITLCDGADVARWCRDLASRGLR